MSSEEDRKQKYPQGKVAGLQEDHVEAEEGLGTQRCDSGA